MEVLGVKVGEKCNDFHKILFYGTPTSFEKNSGETIWAQRLVVR
jgi:hypothetical protein